MVSNHDQLVFGQMSEGLTKVVEIDGDRRVTTGRPPPKNIFRNDLPIDPCLRFAGEKIGSFGRNEPQESTVASLQRSPAAFSKMGGGLPVVTR